MSCASLPHPDGSMIGSFLFTNKTKGGAAFEAKVAPCKLLAPAKTRQSRS